MSSQHERFAEGPGYGVPAQGGGARVAPNHYGERENQFMGPADERMANALGWLSLGLGFAGVAAPGEVARLIGVPDHGRTRDILRAVGVREILSGLGILTQARPSAWVWSRVAGDVMDLALLGSAMTDDRSRKGRIATATAAVAGITAMDYYTSQQLSRRMGTNGQATKADRGLELPRVRTVTIRRPVEEVYAFWRDLSNLPRFMRHLESVEIIDEKTSHWRVKAPAGTHVEWDAVIVDDRPNQLIGWQSLPGAQVENWGLVRFRPAPGDRGTEVRVELEYVPPTGPLGAIVARLFAKDPSQQLKEDLRTFKQVMETGEVVVSDGSLGGIQWPQRPAQPPSKPASEYPGFKDLAP